MIDNLIGVAVFLGVAILIYRYHRLAIEVLRRFDARNVQRIADQEAEKVDPLAHFKHTLKTAEEQVEAVSEITVADERLGTPVTRYIFEGQHFGTRWEADHARAEKIRVIASGFYRDLPRALAERPTDAVHGTTQAPRPASPATGSNVTPFRRPDETLH